MSVLSGNQGARLRRAFLPEAAAAPGQLPLTPWEGHLPLMGLAEGGVAQGPSSAQMPMETSARWAENKGGGKGLEQVKRPPPAGQTR